MRTVSRNFPDGPELGVLHEVIAFEGAPHGMESWEGRHEWMIYEQRVVEWILRAGR